MLNKVLGILQLSSKTVNTGHKPGIIYKKFIPFLSNVKPFLVKTKLTTLVDIIALVDCNKCEVIQYYDNILNNQDFASLLTKANWTKIKKLEYEVEDLTPNRIDLTNINSYTIDPLGSNDRDDALSIVINDNIEIYIHIADPTSYFKYDSKLEEELSKRCYTIYLKNIIHHMIPEELSTNIISLNNKISRTFTCKIIMSQDYKIVEVNFFKALITPINLTYEEADTNRKINKDLENLYLVGEKLKYHKYDYNIHEMVANYMVLCNHLVGCELKDNCIFRHNNSEISSELNYTKVDNTLQRLNYYASLKCAEYSVVNKSHTLLGLDYYTHFTSPIRRYTDIVVHRLLYDKITNKKTVNYNLEQITIKLNLVNKLYKLGVFICDILETFKEQVTELSGTVIFINNDFIKIYNEEYNITFSFNIVFGIIRDVYNINLINNQLIITNKNYENNNFILDLYGKVKFKLYKLKFNNKIYKIELTSPSICEFIIN